MSSAPSLSKFEIRKLGQEKLKSAYSNKQSVEQLQLLNNRIQQLIKQEKQARQSILSSEKKAEILQRNRQRHLEDIERKRLQSEIKEQKRKEANETIKKLRNSHKNVMQNNFFNMKSYASSARELRRKERSENDLLRKQQNEEHLEERKTVCKKIVNARNQSWHIRSDKDFEFRDKLRKEYLESIEESKRRSDEVEAEIKQASESEIELIERLSYTVNNQNNALMKLQKAQKESRLPIETRTSHL